LPIIVRGTSEESAYNAAQAEQARVQQTLANERAAAIQASQSPTKTIGKYPYVASYLQRMMADDKPVDGTITLTDIGYTLSGEQGRGEAKPTTVTFFDSFGVAAQRRMPLRIIRSNYRFGVKDFRVVLYPPSYDHDTKLIFLTIKDRDAFF